MNEVFSRRIAAVIKNSKMSYSDIAKSAGVAVNTVANCASGVCNPSINNAIKIARALDISLDYLCGFGAKKCISGLEVEKPPVTEVKTPPEIKRVYITRPIVFSKKMTEKDGVRFISEYTGLTPEAVCALHCGRNLKIKWKEQKR